MTTPTVLPADLLSQLSELIAATETASVDAEKWRYLIQKLRDVGYGPLLDPDQIAYLIPNARYVAKLAADSQEVPAPTAAPKSNLAGKRRIITEDDKDAIRSAHALGWSTLRISRDVGYSKSAIEKFLYPVNADAAR